MDTTDHFGGCPECGKTDGYLNAGRAHRFYCVAHKTSWCVGSNLFSSWRDETEEEQRKKWEEVGLDSFRDVKPLFKKVPVSQPRQYRDVLHEKIVDVAYASIGGSPWADEAEQGLTDIKSAIDAAIDGNALLADIFNRQVRSPEDEVDDDGVPF